MTLPLGRFVHAELDPGTSAALAAARVAAFVDLRGQLWTWDAFKVRYVRTPAGAKRYGVPIGSPIPVGRKVKAKSGGSNSGGSGGSGSRSTPNRVQMSPAERTVAQRAFGGDNDNGARINERGELEITDNERAKKRLDATANNPNTSAADKKAAQDLHRRIDVLPPADDEDGGDEGGAPAAEPPAPEPEPAPTPATPPQVVELEDADRPIIDQAFGGDEDHGARVNDDGHLEVTDPDRATERLTELLTGDTAGDISDADWSRIESIQDDLAELERPNAPGMTPNELTDDYASKVDLSQAQKDAVASYTGAGYHGINARLRGQDYSSAAVNDPAELQRQTDLINEAMGRYTTPDTITAHRSIYGESGFPDGDIAGQVITSPGFSSTAVGRPAPGFGNGENHLEITIPKGSHGIDVGGSGAGAFGGDEREFILPNNTRYRVDSVEYRMKDGERQRVLKVTALPPIEEEPVVAAAAPARLVLGRFVASAFKVRYVRTPEGARRYGVPIGSPIPIGRRVKVKPTGAGRGGRAGGSHDLPPMQRPAARRHFWGADDNGARWDDDTNRLDVTDPDRATAALDDTLANPNLDPDERAATQQLRDRIAGTGTDDPGPEPTGRSDYRPARHSSADGWAEDTEIAPLVDRLIDGDNYMNGDVTLAAVWERQGFDGRPTVLPADEFDDLPYDYIRIYRGIADLEPGQGDRFAEQFRSGDKPYPGYGVYGNGTYTATDRDTAADYMAGSGALLEMALRPDARVIDSADLDREARNFYGDLRDANPAVADAVYDERGVLASMLGYDAIRVRNPARSTSEDYYVVLNRTAVIVKEAAA